MSDSSQFEPELEAAIELLSTNARLLVASDFDGTISKFTIDPQEAALDPIAQVALRTLSELPNTFVAVISGRSLKVLREKFENLERLRLVGSHGHEFDIDQVMRLNDAQHDLLQKAQKIVADFVARHPGTSMELKPHGVAFHFRGAVPIHPSEFNNLKSSLEKLGSGSILEGNLVLEYSVHYTDKGLALRRIQEHTAPTITVFIGDDFTDEAAFRQLDHADISVKVGDEESFAKFRVRSANQAIQLLTRIAGRRGEWIHAASAVPIDKHMFLSDLRTAALIDSCGTINWLCTPRFDGAPLFGALVGGPGAGHYRLGTGEEGCQDYIGNSLVGRTSFNGVSITDFLDCSAGRSYQRAGRSDLVRIVEGSGVVRAEFAPKYNFGRVPTRLCETADGLKIDCGQQQMVLISPGWEWKIVREGAHDVARSSRVLNAEYVALHLLIGTASTAAPVKSFETTLGETMRFWGVWADSLKLPQMHSALAARSAVVLRGLCYGPTGAITAAPTTSLPEAIGGMRNWDYRYCWPRDACLAATALLRLGASGPAMRLLDWLLAIVLEYEEGRFLSPLYTIMGRTVPGEAEVSEAFGYRGSRPVRIGNLASDQLQLDCLGPIAELMYKLTQNGASLTSEHLQLAERLVALVQLQWTEPDSGVWELRGPKRHFVHSKLMCWYTVYCCIKVSEFLGVVRGDWNRLAEEIRAKIESAGYDEKLQSYIAAYDLPQADAALLWIILSGFHPPDHPRSRGTLRFVMQNLVHEDCVYRYCYDDSMHGQEGEFIICRFWLIEALVIMGEISEAQLLLSQIISRMTPLGLLSEQWHGKEHIALGNYPQSYSHLGLINSLCAMDCALR